MLIYLFVYLYAFPYISACVYLGPFDSALSSELALEQISKHRSQLEALKQEESTILQGLGFFKIEQPPSKSIKMLEQVCHCTTVLVLNILLSCLKFIQTA